MTVIYVFLTWLPLLIVLAVFLVPALVLLGGTLQDVFGGSLDSQR